MKYTFEHEIEVPFEEKVFILPEPRIKLFHNLIENYKVYCPQLKMIYACMNYNPDLKVDYLLIFTATVNGVPVVFWDCPFLYSNRAIPAYRYICRNGLHEQYFTFCMESICRTIKKKFDEFIESGLCGLSLDKNSPLYWKKPENSNKLIEAVTELSMEYVPDPSIKGVRVAFHKKDVGKLNNLTPKNPPAE